MASNSASVWRHAALCVIPDGVAGLRGEVRLTAIQHQNIVEGRRIECAGDAAAKRDGAGVGFPGEADIRRQGQSDQDGRLGEHSQDAVALAIVGAIVPK